MRPPLPFDGRVKMATVTWLGEGENGPKETTWGCYTFKVGEPVTVEDEQALGRAAGNIYFKVEGYEKPPEKPPESETEVYIVPAPSEISAQRPFPKPGEPAPPDLIPPMKPVGEPKTAKTKWPKI